MERGGTDRIEVTCSLDYKAKGPTFRTKYRRIVARKDSSAERATLMTVDVDHPTCWVLVRSARRSTR